MSAQQHPTHQAPFLRTHLAVRPSRPSRHEPSKKPERAAALAEADVLERRQLVDRRDDRASPPATHRPARSHDSTSPATAPPAAARANASAPAAAQVTRYPDANDERRSQRAPAGHPGVQGHRRGDRREHHRGHHDDPHGEEPAQRSQAGPRPVVHPAHLVGGPPPADAGERRTAARRARAGRGRPRTPGRGPRRRNAVGRCGRSCASGGPGELGRREPGLALVLDAEGVDPRALRLRHREVRRRPGGTCRRTAPARRSRRRTARCPRSRSRSRRRRARCDAARRRCTSIAARSTPSISPTSGASAAIGPPSWPPKTWTSLSSCSSVARSSTNTPSRQFPSVMTFGVSAMAATLSPPMSVPSISSLADVEDERHATEVVGGAVVEGQVARAHQLARTRLDVAALEVPGHGRPPVWGTGHPIRSADGAEPAPRRTRPRCVARRRPGSWRSTPRRHAAWPARSQTA